MNESAVNAKLASLQDIKGIRDLTINNVRDILRTSLRDSALEIVELGDLTDMSGTNDAFNSSICSLKVTAKLGASQIRSTKEKDDIPNSAEENPSDEQSQSEENKNVVSFDLVVKSPPKASFMRLMHKLTKPFLNEVTWYLDMLNQIEYVEKILEDSEFKIANLVPTCYHAYSNYYSGQVSNLCESAPWFCNLPFRSSEEGILLLENMKMKGYQMHNKMSVLPLDHFMLAMNHLAHFHGRWLTFRWLSEAGKLGDGAWTPQYMKQVLNTQKRPPKIIYKKLISGTRKTVLKILELEGKTEYCDRIRKFFNVTAINKLNQFMGGVATPIDTCCHGDFWSNNIMFKYDSEGKVEGTMLIDFQLINYGHPAYDVLYLFYHSSDIEFRDANMESCLHHYWKTFSSYIEKYGPEDLKYDWTEFLGDIETYKSIVFVLASTLLPNVLSDIQLEAGGLLALSNMQRKQAAELADATNPSSKEIKRRVVGLVEEMARDNII